MGDLPDLANLDYRDRVNRAIDYVIGNLAAPLKLENVAKAAAFSPFHFHRIFKAITGETLHDFVKRTRLERSLHLLEWLYQTWLPRSGWVPDHQPGFEAWDGMPDTLRAAAAHSRGEGMSC
jgi:hypothetical protein